jgi:hypothetical protein
MVKSLAIYESEFKSVVRQVERAVDEIPLAASAGGFEW